MNAQKNANVGKINEAFKTHLDPIVGQDAAKSKIKHWIEGAAYGNGYLEPLLIAGDVGMGKTRIMKAIGYIVKAVFPAKENNIQFFPNGENLGTPSQFMDDYASPFVHDKDGMLLVDEAHELPKVTAVKLRDMIQPDAGAKPVDVKHGDATITVDPTRWTALFATNEIQKFSAALRSRLKMIMLEEYTDDQMAQILFNGAKEQNLRFNEDSLLPLAASSRGSARDVVSIVQDLVKMGARKNKTTINKDDVTELLKIRGMFPLGLTKKEVDTLVMLEDRPRQLQSIAAMNNLASPQQRVLDSYLFRRNLMEVEGKRKLTEEGRAYLAELRKRHFIGARKTQTAAF